MLTPPETVTDQQLREAGFTSAAREFPRNELALRLLCAFNGVPPESAPPGWWFYPNSTAKAAWERVAAVIEQETGRRDVNRTDAMNFSNALPS